MSAIGIVNGLCCIVLAAALVITSAIPAIARQARTESPTTTTEPAKAPSEITIIAHVGFDVGLRRVKSGCWTRISVLLANEVKSVEGFLRIRKRDRATVIYEQRIDLPIHSKKLWVGYFLPDDPPEVKQGAIVAEYYTLRGNLLASEPDYYDLLQPTDDIALGIVSETNRRGYRSLIDLFERAESQATVSPRGAPRGHARRLLFTEKMLLPREEIGYQSISAFIWDGGDLAELEPEQSLALRGWVFGGGTLIVAVGDNWERVKQSFLHDTLPVEVLGSKSADISEQLGRVSHIAPPSSGPIMISTARMRRGKALVGSAEQPLVVEGAYGAGRVVYVAFSLSSWAIQNWEERQNFLAVLFGSGKPRLLPSLTGEARYVIDSRLKGNLLSKLPSLGSLGLIAAFLGLYIVLVVPMNYIVFRSLKRIEYAWLVLPLVAIAFGFAAYSIGASGQSKTLDSDEITLVEGKAGSTLATAKTFVSIYSPSHISDTISFPDRPVFSRSVEPFVFGGPSYPRSAPLGATRNPLTLTYGMGFTVSNFEVYPWAARTVECDYTFDLGGQIDAQVRLEGVQYAGTITNRLDHDLLGAALLVGPSSVTYLGNVASGQAINIAERKQTFGTGDADQLMNWVLNNSQRSEQPDPRAQMRGPYMPSGYANMAFFRRADNLYGQSWFGGEREQLIAPNTCLLMAWAERSPIQPVIGTGRSQRQLNRKPPTSVYLFTFPIDINIERLQTISEDLWTVQRLEEGSLTPAYGSRGPRQDLYVFLRAENIFALRPSIDFGGRSLDTLRITIELKVGPPASYRVKQPGPPGPSPTLKVSLLDCGVKSTDPERWAEFGSTTTIVCSKDAARFFHPQRHDVRMKIEFPLTGLKGWPPGTAPVPYSPCVVRVNATLK